MKRMTTILVALVFALVAVGTARAVPGPHHHGRGEGMGKGLHFLRLLDRLDLSADQQKQVASILASHREEIGRTVSDMEEAREALMTAATSDEPSEEAVKEAVRSVAAQEEQFILLRVRIMGEIRGILDPDQLTTLRTIADKRGQRMKGHSDRRLDILDKWIADHSK